MARLVRDSLQRRGYRVFMDVEDLRSGPFNTALFNEIDSAADIVVILTRGSLDRCRTEGDWLRLEVAHAIQRKGNVVPVMARVQVAERTLAGRLGGVANLSRGGAFPRVFRSQHGQAGSPSGCPSRTAAAVEKGRNGHSRLARGHWYRPTACVRAVLASHRAGPGNGREAGGQRRETRRETGGVRRKRRPLPSRKRRPRAGNRRLPSRNRRFPLVHAPVEPPKPPGTLHPPPANTIVETNSIGMKMVLIPAGEFTMGSNDNEDSDNEKPPHRVRITKPFYLGQFHVTVGQYRQFVEQSGYTPSVLVAGVSWKTAFPSQPDDCPVVNVSWNDAQAFCDWLSKKEGKAYRLPTEAEWEYACRAGTQAKWSFGDDEGKLGDYAWFSGNSRSHTHPVGQKKPNAWGLYDMLGNACEWVRGLVRQKLLRFISVEDPVGQYFGPLRVLRGGSWFSSAINTGCANRSKFLPVHASATTVFGRRGLRSGVWFGSFAFTGRKGRDKKGIRPISGLVPFRAVGARGLEPPTFRRQTNRSAFFPQGLQLGDGLQVFGAAGGALSDG